MITPQIIRSARTLLGLHPHELAALAGVSTDVVVKMEASVSAKPRECAMRIQAALESAGIEFVHGDGGARLKNER